MKMVADAHAKISLLEFKKDRLPFSKDLSATCGILISNLRMLHAVTTTCPNIVIFAAHRSKQKGKAKQVPTTKGFNIERKEQTWRCVEGCGACCKLEKGPSFATPEEIFTNPSDVEVGETDNLFFGVLF